MDMDSPELKGCVQLMGSAVSLVPNDEVGANFCFRLVSGVATLIMQVLDTTTRRKIPTFLEVLCLVNIPEVSMNTSHVGVMRPGSR